MADYGKKIVGDNRHLGRLTSARFVHLDGNIAQPLTTTKATALQRVVIASKGIAFVVRTGSRVVASFATTSVEGTYNFGEYLENGITIDVVSGTGSANVSYDVL